MKKSFLKSIEEMNKSEFHKQIIAPIIEKFNIPIYFNSKSLEKFGYEYMKSNKLGTLAYYENGKEKVITIKWQNNKYETLFTLFHELGHLTLEHLDNDDYNNDDDHTELELEADIFSSMCFSFLSKSSNELAKIMYNNQLKKFVVKPLNSNNKIDKLRIFIKELKIIFNIK